MAGGEWPDGNPNDTFWQFNTILDEWKQLFSLQTPRSELGSFILIISFYGKMFLVNKVKFISFKKVKLAHFLS